MKKVLLFIDSLGSGGAQRQITLLASLLINHGLDVAMVTYNKGNFFEDSLIGSRIKRYYIKTKYKLLRPFYLRKIINEFGPQTIISFMMAPSLYAEIANLTKRNVQLIVSERNGLPVEKMGQIMRMLKYFHYLADEISTNSYTYNISFTRAYPKLSRKLSTIYNAVDLEEFYPNVGPKEKGIFNFVVLASHKPEKNFKNFAKAILRLKQSNERANFQIKWYGDEGAAGELKVNQQISNKLGIDDIIYFHPAIRKPAQVYDQADALILPSLWEGFPNVVCEALACGCPVLMSKVSDYKYMIKESINGFTFDPRSPEDICKTILDYMNTPLEKRRYMRTESRRIAVDLFSPQKYVNSYLKLMNN